MIRNGVADENIDDVGNLHEKRRCNDIAFFLKIIS